MKTENQIRKKLIELQKEWEKASETHDDASMISNASQKRILQWVLE